jgi:TatD DNase family protein
VPEPIHELVDIGANLTHDSFDHDRDAVILRAQAAGVRRMILTGASVDGSVHALEIAHSRPGLLFATAGIHPHHATEFTPDSAELLARLAAHRETVAVGECGLDYFRNFSPVPIQREAFVGQLAIAAEVRKPVFLHQRDAHADFTAILREYHDELTGGVAHCFTGNCAEMEDYLEMGLYIGITGWICDERRGHDLQAAVPHLPLDRLLLETDAPYLVPRDLPVKLTGRRNEPCVLPHILTTVARLLRADPAEVALAATRNTENLFKLQNAVL